MKGTHLVMPVLRAPRCVWLDDAFAGGRALSSQSAYSFRKLFVRMRKWWRNWPIAHTWVVTHADPWRFGLVGGVTGCHINPAVVIATWLERMAASSATAAR